MHSRKWNTLIHTVYDLYGGKKIELDYNTPFQLLCAVILSAQTTDRQVNKITPPFFAKVSDAKDVIHLSLEEIEYDLRYVNFFRNKSRFIKETGTILATEYG
jgi:endonuclease III